MYIDKELKQEMEWFLTVMEYRYGDIMYSTARRVWYVEIVLDEGDDKSVVPALSSQHSDLKTAIRQLRHRMDELDVNLVAYDFSMA